MRRIAWFLNATVFAFMFYWVIGMSPFKVPDENVVATISMFLFIIVALEMFFVVFVYSLYKSFFEKDK